MIELRHKRVLVVGLARSGRAVAHRLAREGARVTVTDARPPASFGFAIKELMAQKIGLELGVHREETFVDQDLIVVSPGVPWDLPPLEAARRHKVTAVPEIEAASWFFNGTLVGITGTNGKTTTTTLLGRMLEASGFPSAVAGNIGVPLISAVEVFSPGSIVVAELSSFQLEAIQSFRPHVAVLLNITPNHLDRHHTFEAYVSAKAQIFRNQDATDCAILNADDPVVMGLAPAIASRKVFFSIDQDLPEGLLLSRGRVLYRVGNLERVLFEEKEIGLRGKFNTQNVMAAAAAACTLGADFKSIRDAVREFTGVEHRLEFVASIRGVDFYNDSKATSVDAAAKALSTFERGVHLILGGKDKGAPYAPLKELIEGRVKFVYLIGAAAEKIAAELGGANLIPSGDLETAVRKAMARAIPGDTVLLSPACSSYDQFKDFEQRGQAFKEAVRQLGSAGQAQALSLTSQAIQARPEDAFATANIPESSSPASAAHAIISADHGADLAAPRQTEAPPPVPVEREYIYEVGGQEMAPVAEYRFDSAPTNAAAAPLIEEMEPVSPYEIVGRQPDEIVAETASAAINPVNASERPNTQAELFTAPEQPSRKDK